MKLVERINSDSLFTKIIIYCIAGVVAVLLLGTIVAFASRKAAPGKSIRKADPSPQKVINMSAATDEKVAAYTTLGELRAVTKAPDEKSDGTVLVVTPWFSYPDGDTVLFEELSDKSRQLKGLITSYFGGYTVTELHAMGEKKVKEDLLHLINEQLVLGKITSVYFDSYVFFE